MCQEWVLPSTCVRVAGHSPSETVLVVVSGASDTTPSSPFRRV